MNHRKKDEPSPAEVFFAFFWAFLATMTIALLGLAFITHK